LILQAGYMHVYQNSNGPAYVCSVHNFVSEWCA